MNVVIEPGKYVVAVSGGVDSIVLLDLLSKQANLELVVAHFDHGIREDSVEDRVLVQKRAVQHDLLFEFEEGKLGLEASEEQARNARYKFLNSIRDKHGAKAVITAHHQDDLLETALINLLRGTGRKGLTSLSSNENVLRPLIAYKKSELVNYATSHKLAWREDSTNSDTDYLRNYIRLKIIPKLSETERQKLLVLITDMKSTNSQLDKEIANYLHLDDKNLHVLDKTLLNNLTHPLACEVMAEWLRLNNIREFDRKTIERLVVAAKTLKPGQRTDVNKQKYLMVQKITLEISK